MEQTEKVNILLVDDRPDKLLALEAVIGDLGNIVKAHSGKDALRCLMNQEFAVILLDVNMPGMDGFETAALVRDRPTSEHTPIIFVTAYNDSDTHMSRGYSLGAVDYILAPVIPEVLRAKVTVFVDLFRKTEQIKKQAEEKLQFEREQSARFAAEAAERSAAFLAEASRVLASTLDYQVTLERVARLAVPQICDWCAVDVVAADGTIRHVAIVHSDSTKVALAQKIRSRFSADPNRPLGFIKCLQSGESELVPMLTDTLLKAVTNDAEHLEAIRSLGVKSYMIVPLQARGRTLGAMAFAMAESNRHYVSHDLALAEDLARRAAISVDNAFLYREAQDAAARLKFLSDAANRLLTAEKPRQILDSLFQALSAHMGLEVYANYLLTDDHHKLRLCSYGGMSAESAARIEQIELGQNICGAVAQSRQPVVAMDLLDSNVPSLDSVRALGIRAFVCFPLLAGTRLFGTISYGTRGYSKFKPEELAVIQTFCNQVAVALERARLITESQQRADALAEASRVKDEFLAIMSHELRTPLTPILGWVRMISRKTFDQAKVAQGLQIIDRNAVALTKLVEDLLDVSRIVTGKLRLNVHSMDIIQVIETALDTVRPAAEAKGIQLMPCLNPASSAIVGDPDRLQQVMRNLLSNAVKFTSQGGKVEICLDRAGSNLRIVVRDTGQGISQEFLPYVFDRFRQADSSVTRKYGGLGLGLAIVRHLVELHGGAVHVKSDGVGKGAEFSVTLPIAHNNGQVQDDSKAIRRSKPYLPTETNSELSGLKILVVEDEVDSREFLASVFEHRGAKVTSVSSARDAMESINHSTPDVLISDIGMANEDGYALIRQVRALPPKEGGEVPAVALTAYAKDEDRARAISEGFQIHIAKPVDPVNLVEAVAAILKE